MQNPVLAGIVNESTTSGIPMVNDISNVNNLLGTYNIVGVKTGNTDQAGGVFVGAVKFKLMIILKLLSRPTLGLTI